MWSCLSFLFGYLIKQRREESNLISAMMRAFFFFFFLFFFFALQRQKFSTKICWSEYETAVK